MKDLFKNIWNAKPNKYWGIGIAIILFGFLKAINYEFPTTQAEKEKIEKKEKLNDEIKYMKACSAQLRIDRVSWYLDEMGITDGFEIIDVMDNTDLYKSNKPYELMESYKAMGIQPKTGKDLPYFNCAPNAKNTLPKEFLKKFGY